MIENEDYLKYAIFYVHYNPVKHGIKSDFKTYDYSSYKALLSAKPTKLNRNLVMEIFGGKPEFIEYHNYFHDEKQEIIIE